MSLGSVVAGVYCRWVIAKEYYDGPMSGVAWRVRDDALIFFQVVAWDAEQWERVFAIAPTSTSAVEQLRTALNTVELQREPFWFPGPQAHTPEVSAAWEGIVREAVDAQDWQVVESHDLLGVVTEMSLSRHESSTIGDFVRRAVILDVPHAPLLEAFMRQLQGNLGSYT